MGKKKSVYKEMPFSDMLNIQKQYSCPVNFVSGLGPYPDTIF